MSSIVFEQLIAARTERGAGFIVLVDPDRTESAQAARLSALCEAAGVDAFFVGSSLLYGSRFDEFVGSVKAGTSLPIIGFPGSVWQLCPTLDAVLYLSVISSRNPEYLFGQHVQAAPVIRNLGLESISTGYMIVESGRLTTAQYITGSAPLPRNKPDVAAATALAAEMMGMKLLFADGGSGADGSVPETLIEAIKRATTLPLVVGGGIRTPDDVERKVRAGADFVVIGNAIEERPDAGFVAELAAAAHVSLSRTA